MSRVRKTIDTPMGPAFTVPQFRNWFACAVIPGGLLRKYGDKEIILAADADRWNASLSDNEIKDRRLKRRVPKAA